MPMPAGVVIRLRDVWMVYRSGKVEYAALKGISLEIEQGVQLT